MLRLSPVVVSRARSDLAVVGAAWILLLSATSVLSATVLYADTVATGGLRETVAAQDVASRNVDVRVPHVLRREELIGGREHVADGPDIDDPVLGVARVGWIDRSLIDRRQ